MGFTTNDPLLLQQWHLTRIGLDKIFDQYRGDGVRVGVYDNGVESSHAGLSKNYNSSLEISVNGVKAGTAGGNHGTAVAGVIAAAANDGVGGIGVASEADVTGVNIFTGAASGAGLASAVRQMAGFDVVNNSWGWTTRYADGPSTSFGRSFVDALDSAAASGRGGLGTIIVNSAGNDWRNGKVDANASEFNASRATITVGAVGDNDIVSSYSNRGASLLISAPSNGGSKGIVTTDLSGSAGYSSSDHTTTFGGTSAAAPIISGVAALMLEANPLLGWRDVQAILALTAEHIGSAVGGALLGNEAFGWSFNHAGNFNGGGMHFSNDYGFGLVDARAAVRLAEVWSLFNTAQTSANEKSAQLSLPAVKAIADGGVTTLSAKLDSDIAIEHVDLTLNLTHADVNQLRIELVSPDGSVSQVLTPGSGAKQSQIGWTWNFGSEAFRGETAQGEWTVRVTDTVSGGTGMIQSATINVYGQAKDANDVYHFTDAYAGLSLDASRTILTDKNDGYDWIDASTTQGGAFINLESGTVSWIAGAALTIAAGSFIEGAIGGDGDDVLIGNAFNNSLRGGLGADVFTASFGQDVILDFAKGVDKIAFTTPGLSFAQLAIADSAAGSLISFGADTILVAGVYGLGVADFQFGVDLAGVAPRAAADWA